MEIRRLIQACDNILDNSVDNDFTQELASILVKLLTHIEEFSEKVNCTNIDFTAEYFNRCKHDRNIALETFSDILDEMSDYLYD